MPPFNVGGLLPAQLEHFFRYNGSLTTPPCYQSVLWTVFSSRVQISVEQVSGGTGWWQETPLSPSDPSLTCTLVLRSWRGCRQHCSLQSRRSPRSSWLRTSASPNPSISEGSWHLLTQVTVLGLKDMRHRRPQWQEVGSLRLRGVGASRTCSDARAPSGFSQA